MQDNDLRRLRGKSAIDKVHEGISGEDEMRLETAISTLYGVDNEEAVEIHANYHIDRVFASLVQRAEENGMKKATIAKRLTGLDITGIGSQVARGKLVEAAAVELLFRQLASIETRGDSDNRYFQFYS